MGSGRGAPIRLFNPAKKRSGTAAPPPLSRVPMTVTKRTTATGGAGAMSAAATARKPRVAGGVTTHSATVKKPPRVAVSSFIAEELKDVSPIYNYLHILN